MSGRTPAAPRLDGPTRLALGAMALAIFVVANDFTALSVALPSIERDLHADLSTVQWVVNAYSLVFGVLTVTGGRLADLLGRRRVFVTGAGVFAACSLLAALAPNADVLIGARALMAVGGALMWPAALGMTYGLLPPARRGLAGGLILGVIGLGNAAGPLIGGVLTDALDWRFVLAVNVPIAALAVAVVLRSVGESRDDRAERHFDFGGIALLTGSLVALLLALDQAAAWGWGDWRILVLLVAAAVLMGGFVATEREVAETALVPPDVTGNRTFRAVIGAVLLMSMTFFTALVYLPQFMERLLGFSPLGAGLGMLPLMLVFGVTSFFAGPLYERFGARRVLVAGAGFLPVGMLLLSLLGPGGGYLLLVPGMVGLGLGTGLFYSAATTTAIGALDESRASLASGILYLLQVAGGSVGLAVATLIVTGAGTFTDGLREAFQVSAVLADLGLVVVIAVVRPPRAIPVPQPKGV